MRPGFALLLLVATIVAPPACRSPCLEGYTEVDGRCVAPDGSATCQAAPVGLYAGTTDQGLPISFEVNATRTQVVNFRIDTDLVGANNAHVVHEIRWGPGFPMIGCAFAGTLVGGEYSGSFIPPDTFAGVWADSVTQDISYGYFTGGGTFTAQWVSAADGGATDGGGDDGGGIGDGGPSTDGGMPLDGGTPLDGGPPVDGGPPADGGAPVDGGAASSLTLPEGFSSEILADNLLGPIALALEPATGDLFVAEHLAGSVTRFSRDGASRLVATGLIRPRGLSFVPGPADRLYVSQEQALLVIDLSGSTLPFGPFLSFSPGPLVCDPTPRCFVAEFDFGRRGQAVWLVTAEGASVAAGGPAGIDQPFGLLREADSVLVAEANLGFSSADHVLFHRLLLDGGVTGFNPVPLVAQPGALASLHSSLAFVSEVVLSGGSARRVFLLDRSVATTREFARGFSIPAALAYDAAHRELYVADLGRGALFRILGPFDGL
jgi:hypothetical protein